MDPATVLALLQSLGPSTGLTAGTAAAAGTAIAPGIGTLLLPLLLHFGPALFSKIFGGNAQEKLRQQVMALTSPANVSKLTGQFYQGNIASPAYSQGQSDIATGANQTANNVAQSLAARGIGTSGTGAILNSLTPSLVGSGQAGLKTGAYNAAGTQAQQSIADQLNALLGTQGPSLTQKLFSGGLESFGPYLQAYMKAKYPSLSMGQPTAGQSAGGQPVAGLDNLDPNGALANLLRGTSFTNLTAARPHAPRAAA